MNSQLNITAGYFSTGCAEGQCGRFGEQESLSLAQLGIERLSSHFTETRNEVLDSLRGIRQKILHYKSQVTIFI